MDEPLVDNRGSSVGEYAREDDSVGSFTQDQLKGLRSVEKDEHSLAAEHVGAMGRMWWCVDASDEMLFHWLCPSGFNAKSLSEQRNACVVKWNPLYWACFLVTFLSLWLGREGHLVVGQGGAVSKEERREEYEVRVHWLYTTSGAMLWVLVRSLLTLVYWAMEGEAVDWVAVGVTWVVVLCYFTSNAVLLRMMAARNMVGTRSIIVCNGVFALCMAASVVTWAANLWWGFHDLDPGEVALKAYVLFEKASAVVFFLMATVIYLKLWNLYKYDGRDIKRRFLEILPALLSAGIMTSLMWLGLAYHDHEFQGYFWATFT